MIQDLGFELSISGRDDGTIEAAYVRLSRAKVAKTTEVVEDILMADYSASGALVGIEVLAPVKLSQLTRLVDAPKRASLRRFLRNSAPGELVKSN